VKKRYSLLISTVLLGMGYSSASIATAIDLGAASDYNVFVKDSFTAVYSDVEGRVAAGGDVSVTGYSINLANSALASSDTIPALVVGGDLNVNSAQVYGNVYVEGDYNATQSFNIIDGSVNSTGVSGIDFESAFSTLAQLSGDLSSFSANSTAIDKWSTQYLTGTGSNNEQGDIHIFSLDSSDFNYSNYLLSGIDAGDTIVFNVAGDNISTGWGNLAGSDFSLSDLSANIIYNFYEADFITLTAAMYGSILAPMADIYSNYGVIEGQVIANSWTGSFQVNDNSFVSSVASSSNSVSVSAPTSMAFLLLGLLTITMRRSFRK